MHSIINMSSDYINAEVIDDSSSDEEYVLTKKSKKNKTTLKKIKQPLNNLPS